jgi:heme oxygenase
MTTPSRAPESPGRPLSAALRERTRTAHERAENAPFVHELLTGALPLSAYAALAAQNLAVYRELEASAARWRGDPVAGPFVLDELDRVPHLEEDLGQLLGPDWRTQADRLRLPATDRYVQRIRAAARRPDGFVAHHYVRYLGDLSGGQIIRAALVRLHGPRAHRFTNFYVFDGVGKLKPFRDHYRSLLDGAPLTSLARQRLLAEAVQAFELNSAVFADLRTRFPCGIRPDDRAAPPPEA